MAAGLAREGKVPVVAIYSTFLQRAYDQVFHDVVLNGRPVVFCMDRGGIVGEDGWSHHGLYDLAYLRTLPRVKLMAPKDAPELDAMLRFAVSSGEICAIRYPRGSVPPAFTEETAPVEMGKAEVLEEGPDGAIVAYGAMVRPALEARRELERDGLRLTLVNARFASPVDSELIESLGREMPFLLTAEEASLPGGFGAAVLEALESAGLSGVRVRRLGVPAQMQDHSAKSMTMERLGLTAEGIATAVRQLSHEKASHPTWR